MEKIRRSKRANQFDQVYEILCGQKCVNPLATIQTNLAENRLRFCCDRVSFEDWQPILKSLAVDRSLVKIHVYSRYRRKKILETIDTQEKLDEYRRFRASTSRAPIIYTNFLLRCFVDAVAVLVRHSTLLTSLSLHGIPLSDANYLGILCAGLTNNRNLQNLSLARCRIGDKGCAILFHAIVENSCLQTIDLTACSLTSKSADSLVSFLKKKRVQLLKSIWHQTGIPDHDENEANRGLQTLVLDQNRKFGDVGFRLLAATLKDDFWLKTLSIRRCGLTRVSGDAIIDLLETNSIIEEMKFKGNKITKEILRAIRRLLKRRQNKGERIPLKKRLLNRKKDLKWRSPKKIQTNNCQKIHRFNSKEKNLQSREIEGFAAKTPNLMQLNDCLSNVIDCNRNLTRGLANERQMLVTEKLSRLSAERSCQLLRPVFKNLLRGVKRQDEIRGKVMLESNLCGNLREIFNRLESISVKNAKVASELPEKNVGTTEKEPMIGKSTINNSEEKRRTIKVVQKRPYCSTRQHI